MTLNDVATAAWFDTLGGWSNLMQGLGSSVIGGFVAALTAYLVVHWTHKSNMRAAAEMDARAVVRSLAGDSLKVIADVQELVSHPTGEVPDRLRRLKSELKLCQMRFGISANVSSPTIALVDKTFAITTLSPTIEQIDESFNETARRLEQAAEAMEQPERGAEAMVASVEESMASLRTTMALINDLNERCATWLEERNNSRSRGLAIKRRAPRVPPEGTEQPSTTPGD
jgi:hypothetical protein